MRLTLRWAVVESPSKDEQIADLSYRLAKLRTVEERQRQLLAYQRERMKEQAVQNLGLLADRTYLAGLVERLMASMQNHLGVRVPIESTVGPAAEMCQVCPHGRDRHDEWGCQAVTDGVDCRCQVAPIHFYGKAKAVDL